jgi:hypothetical protein
MAQPTPYDRQANFSNEEALNPTGKTPGASLDAEFNSVKVSLDQTQANLALIQRDDGRLANASVGQDQLSPSLSIGFTLRGGWEAPENYVAGDGVTYDNSFWSAASSHTSSVSAPPALDNPLWTFLYSIIDVVPITVPDGSISTAKLANLAVTTAKIDNLAVTAAKIADGVLSADSTGRAKMADGFVTNAKIANMAEATIKGRASGAGTGVPTDLTAAQARTALSTPGFTRRAPVAMTTQTSVDFDTIPAGTVRIVVTFAAFSTNGTSLPIIQIGDSGGIETTGYFGSTSLILNAAGTIVDTLSSGFALSPVVAAATVFQGSVTLDLVDGSNTWAAFGGMGGGAASTTQVAGFKTLSGELDRVRITTMNGTDQMDAGSVNVMYFYA